MIYVTWFIKVNYHQSSFPLTSNICSSKRYLLTAAAAAAAAKLPKMTQEQDWRKLNETYWFQKDICRFLCIYVNLMGLSSFFMQITAFRVFLPLASQQRECPVMKKQVHDGQARENQMFSPLGVAQFWKIAPFLEVSQLPTNPEPTKMAIQSTPWY